MKRNIKATLSGDILSEKLGPYADAHDALTGVVGLANYLTISNSYIPPDSPDGFFQVSRGYLSLNTRFLSEKEKYTATFKLYLYGYAAAIEEDIGQALMGVVKSHHGDTLVPTDFGDLLSQTDVCGLMDASLWLPNTWNAIDLNIDVFDFIESRGITKFGLRLAGDALAEEPTGTNQIQIAVDAAHLPYMEVVYTPTVWKGNINIDQLIYQHAERMVR